MGNLLNRAAPHNAAHALRGLIRKKSFKVFAFRLFILKDGERAIIAMMLKRSQEDPALQV